MPPEIFPLAPEVFLPRPETFPPAPEVFLPCPETFPPAPEVLQGSPESIPLEYELIGVLEKFVPLRPEVLQVPPESFPPASEVLQPCPERIPMGTAVYRWVCWRVVALSVSRKTAGWCSAFIGRLKYKREFYLQNKIKICELRGHILD